MRRIPFFLFALLLSLGKPAIAGEEPDVADVKFRVVINHEEQYTIWVAERELPRGWKAIGFVGRKEEALGYIEEI